MISKLIRWIIAIGVIILIVLTILNRQHYRSMLPPTLFSETEEPTPDAQPTSAPVADSLSAAPTAADSTLQNTAKER